MRIAPRHHVAARLGVAVALALAAMAPQRPSEAAQPAGQEQDAALVRIGNLIYGRGQVARCFSDAFLSRARQTTHIHTAEGLSEVHLDDEALFDYPFVIMSGQEMFTLTPPQRRNMRRYLEGGGFILASAGCGAVPFDGGLRRELARVFPEEDLKRLPPVHPIFHTVHDIGDLRAGAGAGGAGHDAALEALTLDGRVALVYAPRGLNDTNHAGAGCACCCGHGGIANAIEVNVNLLAYALTH